MEPMLCFFVVMLFVSDFAMSKKVFGTQMTTSMACTNIQPEFVCMLGDVNESF